MQDDHTLSSPVILVDGSSFLYRAFHALPELTNDDHFPTGAIYGTLGMLRKLIHQYQPSHMAVIFDTKAKTKRHERYPAYKANRAKMPESLQQQIPPLHTIIQAMGLTLIMKDGFEADDIIGTLAHRTEKNKQHCLIVTSDKDMAQLVTPYTTLYNSMQQKTLDVEGVLQKFGVAPEQIIDYLALMGDASDNIPGIPKVGPKTARKWLQHYGNLEQITTHAHEISGKVGDSLREYCATLPLNVKLVTIDRHVPLDHTLDDLIRKKEDTQTLQHWFKQLGFKTWMNPSATQTHSRQSIDTRIITTCTALKQWIASCAPQAPVAWWMQTSNKHPHLATITGIAMATAKLPPIYYQLTTDTLKDGLACIQPLLNDTKRPLIGHHLVCDISILHNHGVTVHAPLIDVMLMSQVLNNHQAQHDTKRLIKQYLEEDLIDPKTIETIDDAAQYAGQHVTSYLKLHQHLTAALKNMPHLQTLLQSIEFPLQHVLARIMNRGVLIDTAQLNKQDRELQTQLNTLAEEAKILAGGPFNLNSSQQLQSILYDKQHLPILKKTQGGKPSTAEAVLRKLAINHPLPRLILHYRQLNKLHTTYTSKLPQVVCKKTNRIHTTYQQIGTHTGRLSSAQPNLQNIPIRSEEGRRIRKAFIAPPHHQIVAADYSQIELRIMAHLSGDTTLTQAFKHNCDIHRATASEIFAVPYDAVSQDQRRKAKSINFGLIYGMSAFGLAKQLSISHQEAQDYINRYFERYPAVLIFMEKTRQQAKHRGYVETLFGRRLQFNQAGNHYQQMAHERAAINAPLQGSAADIIKCAMIRVDQHLRKHLPDVYLIMQVHDELVFEVPDHDLEPAMAAIRKCMEESRLAVPLTVDMGYGPDWLAAH